MDNESIFGLKKKFRETFPEHTQLLDLAKSQDEIDELHTRFVSEAKDNLVKSMKEAGVPDAQIKSVSGNISTTIPSTLITNELYKKLINAQGNEIENELHVLMDSLQRLKNLTASDDTGYIVASCIYAGFVAFNGLLFIRVTSQILLNAYERLAYILAVDIADISILGNFIAFVNIFAFVVFAVVIPILYFTGKPANCVLVLINETDKTLYLKEDHAVHGHATGTTNEYAAAVKSSDGVLLPTMGFTAVIKSKSALVGSQYGFILKDDEDPYSKTRLAFAVENPLTSMYDGNNCFCGFDISAKEAAKQTNKHNKQEYTAKNDTYNLSIKCNSTHGSTSYYIARVYKTEK